MCMYVLMHIYKDKNKLKKIEINKSAKLKQ